MSSPLPAPPWALFPANSIWGKDISAQPVHGSSSGWINAIGGSINPYFGSLTQGIPYLVTASLVMNTVNVNTYPSQSEAGPLPFPSTAPIENGADLHCIVISQYYQKIYEMWQAAWSGSVWNCGSLAIFDPNSNRCRPDGWTSAEAGGMSMLRGLIRYDEILGGALTHATRFIVPSSYGSHVWPSRHDATGSNTNMPPMGARFRLKASFNIGGYSATNQIILAGLKKYGMIVADNGGNGTNPTIYGTNDSRWSETDRGNLAAINFNTTNFEAVDCSSLQVYPDSEQSN